MIRFVQFFRLIRIYFIILRHGFRPDVVGKRSAFLRVLSYLNIFRFGHGNRTRAESMRITLEKLGPIFVKFGQLLSTRRDLLSEDIINELERLQDRVPPFPGEQAQKIIEKTLNATVDQLFAQFDRNPMASASIAQVHAATTHNGEKIIVKVLRPGINKIIASDVALMLLAAKIIERFVKRSRRIHPIALVREFERTIIDEQDLMYEAANASQLRRNFIDSEMMYVPKIYWDFTRSTVLVAERIYGIQINNTQALKAANTDLKKLAEYGVIIFFTQVFRDSFFHADMHPGNLFVDANDPQNPKYIGVDFGIMGTLSPEDQHYLAGNLLAFFNRDYREVALLHIESGWVPADTRIDQFESAIRTVCEPIFEKPLKEISFGQLLLRLFQTVERFHMEVQPQLMLLQKTLLAIEGLGRQLYPDLDLWETAKPFMVKHMRKRKSLSRLAKNSLRDWQTTVEQMAKTPREVYEFFHDINLSNRLKKTATLTEPQTQTGSKKSWFYGAASALTLTAIISLFMHHHPINHWQWANMIAAASFWLVGWSIK